MILKRALLIFFLPIILFAQDKAPDTSLQFDEKRHTLSLDNQLVPQWLTLIVDMANPRTQYNFILKHSTTYSLIRSWYKVDKPKDLKEWFLNKPVFNPDKRFIEQGWFYTSHPVNNLPDNWYFSPIYSLYFNKDGVFKLDRFLQRQLDKIKLAIPDQPNTIKKDEFIKVIIEPAKNIVLVKPILPSNWVVAYSKIVPLGEGQHVLVLTPFSGVTEKDQDPQNLKFYVVYKDKRADIKHYKVFFSLKSQLISY